MTPTSDSDVRPLRGAGAAMVSYGLLAALCWWLTRTYAVENGGQWLWGIGVATGIGYAALGVLVLRGGGRRQRAARNYAGVLVIIGFVVPEFVSKSSVVWALSIVSGAAFLTLLWGRAGKIRTIIGFVGVGASALLLIIGTARHLLRPPVQGPPVAFEVMAVDDADDVTAYPMPSDASLSTETIDGQVHHFFRFSAPAGTPFQAARARADSWVNENVPLPTGTSIAWERVRSEPGMVLRSYLLQQPAFVTAADVESTYVGAEDGKNYVAVTLRAAGAARLRDVTGSHKGGRLAILFDGSVEMAPVVRSEITDGHVSISLWKDATREEAEGLAAGLRGDLWHGG